MYTGSMSQIARANEQQQNNVSEVAFQGNNNAGLQRQNLPDVQSQILQRQQKQGKPLQYKKQLLKLMVEVRLEEMGYAKKDVKKYSSNENFFPQDLEEVQLNELSYLVNQMVMYFIYQGSSEPQMAAIRFNRIERSRRSAGSQRMAYERQINRPNVQIANLRVREISFEPQARKTNIQPIKPLRQILCSICYTLSTQFSQQLCNHSFCDDCFRGFIKQSITSGTYSITCPEYNCSRTISLENIRRLIGTKQYERYIFFKEKNQKQLNPNNRFCSRPDCGQILTKMEKGLFCDKCRTPFCQICLQKLHQGSNCDQAIKNAIDQTFSTFKIKKCPNCKSPIEKSQGCNHMSCKKCKHQFCWVCLKTYTHFHYKYYNCFGCPGMQFQDQQGLAFERSKQILFYLLLPLLLTLILVCYLAIIPIYMIGCFFYKPCEWVQNNHRALERDIVQKCCCILPECMQTIFLWFLFIFRSILYAIFVAPVKITGIICGGLCRVFFQ